MIVVSIMNQKGGVGKTTTAVNLGVAIAAHQRRVLLIDLDPQANLGTHLGVEAPAGTPTIYDVLVKDVPLAEVIRPTAEEGVDCVSSNIDLSAAELELVSMVGRETLLRDALERLESGGQRSYDYVLIDCPPSLGVLSINALAAASRVLVPLQAEFFALQGMAKLIEVIDLVQRRLNPRVFLSGIVACKVDRRPRLTQEVLDEVRKYFGDQLMETMIRPNVKLAEAPSFGMSVLSYAPESNGAADYRQLAREFLSLPREIGEALESEVTAAEDAVQLTEPPAGPPTPEPEPEATLRRRTGEYPDIAALIAEEAQAAEAAEAAQAAQAAEAARDEGR